MKSKGFSLVELLAVIVIIAVIALIATPIITGMVNDSKLHSLKDSAYGVLKAANLYYAQYRPKTNVRFDIEGNNVTSNDTDNSFQYKGFIKEGAVIVGTSGKITMCVTDGKNSAYKNYSDNSIVLVENDSCYIPENRSIVYLAGGGATKDELSNEELTDLVTSLQGEIGSLRTEVNTLKQENATLKNTVVSQTDLQTVESQVTNMSTQMQSQTTTMSRLQTQVDTMGTQMEAIGTIANSSTLDKAYPVGSIYVSVTNTNPSTLFGGTWVSFGTGRTLVGVDTNQTEFDTVEETGGEKTHTLTTAELPSHTHGSKTLTGSFVPSGHFGNGTYNISAGALQNEGIISTVSVLGDAGYIVPNQTLNNGMGRKVVVDASHEHSSVGNNQSHNNLQPYITVYMWKRTA